MIVEEQIVQSVTYIVVSDLIKLVFKSGVVLTIPCNSIPLLNNTSVEQLKDTWINETGTSIYWKQLDVEINVIDIVNIVFYNNNYMSELGRRGGQVKSDLKAESSRVNGKKGGRPKKCGAILQQQ